jgi:hypothetical protein
VSVGPSAAPGNRRPDRARVRLRVRPA